MIASRELPYLVVATVLLGALATARTAPPMLWALWAIIGATMVWAGHRPRAVRAGRVGGQATRAAAALIQLDEGVPELRLRAVRELAAIADEWPAGRQACIDALCAYLRRPFSGGTFGELTIRTTTINLIREHLQPGADRSWRGCDINLSGASIHDASFAGAQFADCLVDFTNAQFRGDMCRFTGARFERATVLFAGAQFCTALVDFAGSEFRGGTMDFSRARQDRGRIDLSNCRMNRNIVSFAGAHLDGTVDLSASRLEKSRISFDDAHFCAGTVRAEGITGGAVVLTL
ncbi:pentapeptide repeat-containing protein [Allorhizocola rhizosphaerae]|uniref:pentapeptide repeat-containing protein n=1 Tax=Allorhizocola rhizosphaerae TaxID=1872709 RepID=UPI000E3CF2EB|nr:pentapeptide repeat-containing protein [Allorhizocola rhizosphaerae]